MPSVRTIRRVKRSTLNKSSRCSSMAAGFSKKNLIASSPVEDDCPQEDESHKEEFHTLEYYRSKFQQLRDKITKQYEEGLHQLSAYFLNLRMSLPTDLLNATLGSTTYHETENETSEVDTSSISNDTYLMPVRSQVLRTDSDVFKRPMGVKKKVRKTTGKQQSKPSKFKTPDQSSQMPKLNSEAMTITPKLNPNTPMSMMRRPKQGEVAVSMTGSPLLVSTIVSDVLPHVTVPFGDGRVFSIMPNNGEKPDHIPEFDDRTKNYLKTLQEHLKAFCEQ